MVAMRLPKSSTREATLYVGVHRERQFDSKRLLLRAVKRVHVTTKQITDQISWLAN